jgi:hypothetical protein
MLDRREDDARIPGEMDRASARRTFFTALQIELALRRRLVQGQTRKRG